MGGGKPDRTITLSKTKNTGLECFLIQNTDFLSMRKTPFIAGCQEMKACRYKRWDRNLDAEATGLIRDLDEFDDLPYQQNWEELKP